MQDKVLISEIFLYLFCFLSFLVYKKEAKSLIALLATFFLLIGSSLYGVFLQGLNMVPIYYSLRLFSMLFAGWMIGIIAFEKFRTDLQAFFQFLVKIYFYATLLGALIFLLFPNSDQFWIFLRGWGIQFNGDPHYKRFISIYFDPNYYGAIACMPILLSAILYQITKKTIYLGLLTLFFITLVLTWSRSALATFFLLAFMISAKKVITLRHFTFNPLHFICAVTSLCLLVFIFSFSTGEFYHFWQRIINIDIDYSAFMRLESLQFGWEIFKEHACFGIGYNFLSLRTKEFSGLSSVDSSLLTTLINFGLMPFLGFVFAFLIWSVRKLSLFNSFKQTQPLLYKSFRSFYLYLLIVILFASHFNNILYFQFWLIPMISLFTYFSRCASESTKPLRLKSSTLF